MDADKEMESERWNVVQNFKLKKKKGDGGKGENRKLEPGRCWGERE